MQSLDYKLKTSNTSYVTARHDVQYFPSSLTDLFIHLVAYELVTLSGTGVSVLD